MGNLGTLYVAIKTKAEGLKTGLDSAKRDTLSARNKMNDAIGGINFKAIGVAAAAAGATVAYSLKKAIDSASDLQETASKFGVVFKDQLPLAKSWASELVGSYRMSSEQALNFLGNMQDLLVPMGMNSQAAGQMSNQVVKLAADLGSFNNMNTTDVIRDMRAAFAGSFETMNKYGIVIRQASIEQKALNMGLISHKNELTPAIRAQAAFKMMLEGSSAAIGDVSRTTDTYAAQQRQLKATTDDLTSAIGTSLLPVATSGLKQINQYLMDNKQSILDLVKNGVLRLADGMLYVIETLRFFSNAWDFSKLAVQKFIEYTVKGVSFVYDGIRTMLTPLDMLFKGLVKLGKMENNPFDGLAQSVKDMTWAVENQTEIVSASIEANNAKFDTMKNAVATVRQEMEKTPMTIDLVTASVDAATASMVEGASTVVPAVQTVDMTYQAWNDTLTNSRLMLASITPTMDAVTMSMMSNMAMITGTTVDSTQQMGSAFNQYFDGIKKGFVQTTNANIDWSKEGIKSAQNFAVSAQGAVQSSLFDAMTGGLTSMKDLWKKTWEGIAKAAIAEIARIIAKLLVLKALKVATGVGALFHDGGTVGRYHDGGSIPVAHNGMYLKKDEVPIIAQTGEGVLSRKGMQNIGGPAALDALNKSQGVGVTGGGGGTMQVNITLSNSGVITTDDTEEWIAGVIQSVSRKNVGNALVSDNPTSAGL